MLNPNRLWSSDDPQLWTHALESYWKWVKPQNMRLERRFAALDAAQVRRTAAPDWYQFLHDGYFRWKYTAPNRYASTTKHLRKYLEQDGLSELVDIRNQLFAFDRNDIERGLRIAVQIRGLGVAGASGLLAVLFPSHFATVDQFVVKALRQVEALPNKEMLQKMNPEGLGIRDGVTLINMMRQKAADLQKRSLAVADADIWTPRKIDMVLWVCREHACR